jgi:2,3-bisphosphoglycerate-independent phosphoglycerate mutase
MQKHRPVMLVVLDGWGWREDLADNAVRQAHTPIFDRLRGISPHALLQASGKDVGLPPGQMGNSEVGHLNIGAGRIVMQDLQRINDAMADGRIKTAPALVSLIARLRQTGATCHLLGLASPGGVQSHQDHAAVLAMQLSQAGIPTVVHAFAEGRDTPPRSAKDDIKRLNAALPPSVPIATVCGRYYAMDRDHRWERVAKAYDAIVDAKGPPFPSADAVISDAMPMISATSSCCLRSSPTSMAFRTEMACFASTSAPTGCAKFLARSLIPHFPVSRAGARCAPRWQSV